MMKKIHKILIEFIDDRRKVVLFLIAIYPLVFQQSFENLIDKYVVETIFSNIESNLIVDLIAIFVLVIIVTYYVHKIKIGYFVSGFTSWLLYILAAWYLTYRLFLTGWRFQHFSFCDTIYYSDIFLLLPIFYIILQYKQHKKSKRSALKLADYGGFETDEPAHEDKLGRFSYAKEIATKIKLSFPKESFAISIIGEWGSGKTSFLNFIKANLEDSNHQVVISFNPWNSFDSKNIILDFFETFKDKLKEFDASLAFQVKDYADKLTSLDDNIFTKTISFITTSIFGEKTISEKFEEINQTIGKIDKQIIVFIDDLDRLDKNEIIEVIKLIRISANFKNTVFIVAFDRNYVTNAISQFNDHRMEFFLEKIFQVEITLPTFETYLIKNKLIESLKRRLPNAHQDIDDKLSSHPFVHNFICTLRDVTRFTNSFCLSYELLGQNVLFHDLFNIELIRFKYPSVYELIFNKTDDFFETNQISDINHYSLIEEINQDGKKTKKLEDYVKKNYKQLSIQETKIPEILKAINSIFNRGYQDKEYLFDSSKTKHLTITIPSKFRNYSALRLLEGNLSYVEFSKARSGDYENFKEKIDSWVRKGLAWEVMNEFKVIKSFDNKGDFEQVIKGIFHLGSVAPILDKSFSFGYDIEDLFDKLSHFQHDSESKIIDQIAKKYYDNKFEDYERFLLSIFEDESDGITFNSYFLYYVNTQLYYKTYFPLTLPKRLSILFDYFKTCTLEKGKVDSDFWSLYECCHYVIEGQNEVICEDRVLVFFKDFIKNYDSDGFLQYMFNKSASQYIVSKKILIEIFGSLDDFESFFQQLPQTEVKTEFWEFYKRCKDIHFAKYLDVDFKFIQPST